MSKFHEIRSAMKGRFADRKQVIPQVYAEPLTDTALTFVLRHRAGGVTNLARLESTGRLFMLIGSNTLWTGRGTLLVKVNRLLLELGAGYQLCRINNYTHTWRRADVVWSESVFVSYHSGDSIDLDAKYLHARCRNNL